MSIIEFFTELGEALLIIFGVYAAGHILTRLFKAVEQ